MAAAKVSLKTDISKIREDIIKSLASKFENLGFDINGSIVKKIPMSNQDKLIKDNLASLFDSEKITGNQKEFIKYIQDCARTFMHILICFKTMEKRKLMVNLLNEILPNNIYNEVLPDFKNIHPYAFMDITDKYKDEIEKLEAKDNFKEDTDYYKFIYVLNILSKEMAKEVPLLFKDFEHTIIYPDFESIKEIMFAMNNIDDKQFEEDDFLGWIYQYWVDVKADEIKTAKANESISYKDKVYSLIIKELEEEQTQFGEFYTPRWVIKYIIDNTLKKYWEEHKNVDNIKLLDPACGAGNFLVYAFDVFYDLYKSERPNYSDETIIKNILENNIYGVDIQKEPLQISALNLWLKSKKKAADVKITNMKLFNINILKANSLYRYENDIVNYQISIFDKDIDLTQNNYTAEDIGKYISNQEKVYQRKAKDFFLQKFEVIVMNPPFVDTRKMNLDTSNFLKKSYSDNSRNLFSAFIQRTIELSEKNGYIGFISSNTFMYISSFEKTRKMILNNVSIERLIDLGRGVFEGPTVDAVINLYKHNKIKMNTFEGLNISKVLKNMSKETIDINRIINENSDKLIILEQKKLNMIIGKPFLYDISDEIREIFVKSKTLGTDQNSVVNIKQGMATGNNNKFLKYKWEIPSSLINVKYFPYAKGGGFSKYSNDINDYICWDTNAYEYYNTSSKARKNYLASYFSNCDKSLFRKKAITYSDITNENRFSARILPEGSIFDVKGSCIFCEKINYEYLLGFINSKFVNYILLKLNPTPSFQVGDLQRIPFKYPEKEKEEFVIKMTNEAIDIKRELLGFDYKSDFYHEVELELGFKFCNYNIKNAFIKYLSYKENIENKLYKIQNDIDKCIYNVYEISDDDIEKIEDEFGKSAYDYEKIDNKIKELNKDKFEQLYCIGDPNKESRNQRPMSIIEIAEYKRMNPDDVLKLREEYGIYREKDLKQSVLNWLRAIVKDYIKEQKPKLYLDEDIEKIIRVQIEKKFKNGYELISEAEAILDKNLIGVIRTGVKIGSASVTLAGKGPKDLDEPLLQQRIISGIGANKIVVLWHLQQFLLEFEENKKYVMQNEIRRIKELFESRLSICREKLLIENLKSKDKKQLGKQEKLLIGAIKSLENWKVV